MMRRLVQILTVVIFTAACGSPAAHEIASAEGAGNGGRTWQCKTHGDIPIGIFRETGVASYAFQVTLNDAWAPTPDDPGTGSGQMQNAGDEIQFLSGPMVDEYGITTAGRFTGSSGAYLQFDNDYGAVMLCWPPN